MTKANENPRAGKLLAKIYSEGYCCLKGYLELCRLRGETPKGMGENLDVSAWRIQYHYRLMKQGKHVCQNKGDCLKPIIAELLLGPTSHHPSDAPQGGLSDSPETPPRD